MGDSKRVTRAVAPRGWDNECVTSEPGAGRMSEPDKVLNLSERIEEIARRIEMLQANLPKRVDPASVSLKAKIPFKALLFREALIWRFTELCRCALAHFNKENLAAATIVTRAALETVAALWYLNRKIKAVVDTKTVGEIDTY